MKKLFLISVLLLTLLQHVIGQAYKITYDIKHSESNEQLTITFANNIVYLSTPESASQSYIDYNQGINVSVVKEGEDLFKKSTPFEELPTPELKRDDTTITILGNDCSYAKYNYFSNSIEVWYTTKQKQKGSPYSRFVPTPDALVLRVIINGNREIIASSIEKDKTFSEHYLGEEAVEVSDAVFEELKINARFTRLSIFEEEQINFDTSVQPPHLTHFTADSTYRFSNGTVIMKKVTIPAELRNSQEIFATLTCKSNGDAYDRTGCVFILPNEKGSLLDGFNKGTETLPSFKDNKGNSYQGFIQTNTYQPPIEIIRFFTSFGVNHFNDKTEINNYEWEEKATYKQDISALVPSNNETCWIGVFIGNYDGGGHIVSLHLDFHSQTDKKINRYINPLFLTVNTLESSGQNYGRLFDNDTLVVEFETPDSIANLCLLYTTTGHGGWGGGDEFNPKENQLLIDGEAIFNITPWRTDCGTYRMLNPASGNFSNGLSSSDYSRSNWCPGTLTPPYIIFLPELTPGKHQLKVVIDQGEDEASGFNAWSTSGVLVGNKKEK